MDSHLGVGPRPTNQTTRSIARTRRNTSLGLVERSFATHARALPEHGSCANTTTCSYDDPHHPDAPTSITYPASTGLSATHTYDKNANVMGLTAGSQITDAWTYNVGDELCNASPTAVACSSRKYPKKFRDKSIKVEIAHALFTRVT